jgi:hypothetical protein
VRDKTGREWPLYPQKAAVPGGGSGVGDGPQPASRAAKKVGRPARHEAPTAIVRPKRMTCDGGTIRGRSASTCPQQIDLLFSSPARCRWTILPCGWRSDELQAGCMAPSRHLCRAHPPAPRRAFCCALRCHREVDNRRCWLASRHEGKNIEGGGVAGVGRPSAHFQDRSQALARRKAPRLDPCVDSHSVCEPRRACRGSVHLRASR